MSLSELLNQKRLSRDEVARVMHLARIVREAPNPSGTDDGGEYWLPDDVRRWARDCGHWLPSDV